MSETGDASLDEWVASEISRIRRFAAWWVKESQGHASDFFPNHSRLVNGMSNTVAGRKGFDR